MSAVERRVFLQGGEIPGVLAGVLAGRPAALRRVLGARRAGRIAVAAGVAGWLLAVPDTAHLAATLAVQLALGVPGARACTPALTWRAYQRLSLWLVAPALVAAAPLRFALEGAAWPAWIAVLAAHLWLWRHLRRGLLG